MEEKSARREQLEKSAQIARKEIYRGRGVSLHCDTLRNDDGTVKTWDIVVRPDAVVIVPLSEQKEILFIKQWRRSVGRRLIELPAGTLEKDELSASCAQRELQEETGFRAQNIVSLGGYYSTPGFCTEFIYLFAAFDLIHDPMPADEDEAIDLIPLSLKKAEEMIATGEICDAKTIAGIHRYVQWSSR